MKKLYIVLLALTLSIVMLVLAALPVTADPPDNKPVAWVSFGGTSANSKDETGSFGLISILAKRLPDGTTVGNMRSFSVPGEVIRWDIVDSDFEEEGGVKIANILASTVDEYGFTWYFWWRLEDRGEPGVGTDVVSWYVYWPTNVKPPWPPPWPPPAGWIAINPGEAIVSGNIQVHITDDYSP